MLSVPSETAVALSDAVTLRDGAGGGAARPLGLRAAGVARTAGAPPEARAAEPGPGGRLGWTGRCRR